MSKITNKPAAPLDCKTTSMTITPKLMTNPSPPRKSATAPTVRAETNLLFLISSTEPKLIIGKTIHRMNKVRNRGLMGGRESTIGVAIDT
jgi:hypothetical protein